MWFTCLSPDVLVTKYTRYAHGNWLGDRRIVLDKELLPSITAANNIRVIPSKILPERFLATLRDECKNARELDYPVLVLIFGHGDEGTHGVAIGGESSVAAAPRLTIHKFHSSIGNRGKISLLITSCYCGG